MVPGHRQSAALSGPGLRWPGKDCRASHQRHGAATAKEERTRLVAEETEARPGQGGQTQSWHQLPGKTTPWLVQEGTFPPPLPTLAGELADQSGGRHPREQPGLLTAVLPPRT